MMKNKNFTKSLLTFLGIFWAASVANQAPAQITEDESTVTYPRSYFDQYAPVTAKDMLDRIPGLGSTTGGGPPGGGVVSCDEVAAGQPCCGDGMCGGPETVANCSEDCA